MRSSWQGEAWENGYLAAERFFRREGHLLVPQDHVEAGYPLGKWISKQRSRYAEGVLPASRVRRLEKLGMVWNTVRAAWEEGFRHAEQFFKREGHLLVPFTHVEGGYQLGHWIRRQRADYLSLPPELVARLNGIGMVWRLRQRAFDYQAWDAGFAVAEQFFGREGHLLVPSRHVEGGYPLGKWVSKQRARYRQGKLPPVCVARLEGLGMVWSVRGGQRV